MRCNIMFVFLVTTLPLFCACSQSPTKEVVKEADDGHSDEHLVIKTSDGLFQISTPASWSKQSDLHPSADIQMADVRQGSCLVTKTVSKAEVDDPSMEEYSEYRLITMKEMLANSIASDQKRIQIDGHPAIQFQISGKMKGGQYVYLNTTVDTGQHLHQIVAWSRASGYKRNKPVIESIISSFTFAK